MAMKTVGLCFVLLVILTVAEAQQCPGIASYLPCQSYVRKGDATPPAQSQCCSFIKSTSRVSDSCLCDVAKKGKITYLGQTITIDFNTVAKLPAACGRRKSGYVCNGRRF